MDESQEIKLAEARVANKEKDHKELLQLKRLIEKKLEEKENMAEKSELDSLENNLKQI